MLGIIFQKCASILQIYGLQNSLDLLHFLCFFHSGFWQSVQAKLKSYQHWYEFMLDELLKSYHKPELDMERANWDILHTNSHIIVKQSDLSVWKGFKGIF